jgi:hypothetical protein
MTCVPAAVNVAIMYFFEAGEYRRRNMPHRGIAQVPWASAADAQTAQENEISRESGISRNWLRDGCFLSFAGLDL